MAGRFQDAELQCLQEGIVSDQLALPVVLNKISDIAVASPLPPAASLLDPPPNMGSSCSLDTAGRMGVHAGNGPEGCSACWFRVGSKQKRHTLLVVGTGRGKEAQPGGQGLSPCLSLGTPRD